MKKSEAVKLVSDIGWVVQRTRSIIRERTEQTNNNLPVPAAPHIVASVDESMFPLLFGAVGEKWVAAILRTAEKGDALEPQEFYNLCYIAHHLEPIINLMAGVLGVSIPEPSISVMHWEAE